MSVEETSQTAKDRQVPIISMNHFGHFLLTNLLLPTLKKSAPSRVVAVCNDQIWSGQLVLARKNKPEGSTRLLAYSNTRLANILFTRALDRRLRHDRHNAGGSEKEKAGLKEKAVVTVNCADPGLVRHELPPEVDLSGPPRWLLKAILLLFGKACYSSMRTTLYFMALTKQGV